MKIRGRIRGKNWVIRAHYTLFVLFTPKGGVGGLEASQDRGSQGLRKNTLKQQTTRKGESLEKPLAKEIQDNKKPHFGMRA